MATPPPVTAEQAAAAISRIAARRSAIDDPNAWRLSEDPVEVLRYLRMYSTNIPRDVAEADVLDGLVLRMRLWWIGAEAEHWLLERARRVGISPRRLMPLLGVRTRQGLHDRLRLARSKLERLTGLPVTAPPSQRDRDEDTLELRWLADHREEIRAISAAALEYRHLADDEAADWLLDVGRDLRDGVVTPGSLQTLRFALAELETSQRVASIDEAHPLRELLRRWSRLYSSHPGSVAT